MPKNRPREAADDRSVSSFRPRRRATHRRRQPHRRSADSRLPRPHRGARTGSGRLGPCRSRPGARRGAGARPGDHARAAPRHPHRRQGHHGHRRHADGVRLARLSWVSPACRCGLRGAGARRGRGGAGQDRDHGIRGAEPRQDAQPAQYRAYARRLVERVRGGRRRFHGAARLRHADRRVDHPSRLVLRRRRLQAQLRARRHFRNQGAGADIALFIAALTGRPELVPKAPAARPRIGVYRTQPWEQAQPATVAALDEARERLARAGASIAERPAFAAFDRLVPAQVAIMGHEMARNLAWERTSRGNEVMPRTAALFTEGLAITPATYDEARRGAAAARAQLAEFFGDFDAMLVPAAPGEAPPAATTGDPVFNRPWTLLHVPCITLPGRRGPAGLPVGVQLVGTPHSDAALLAVALFAEAAFGAAA